MKKKLVITTVVLATVIGCATAYAFSEYKIEAKVVPFAYHLAGENRDTLKGDNYYGAGDKVGLPQSIHYQGTQYVPIRDIANTLFLEIDWDSAKKVAILKPVTGTDAIPQNLDALIEVYSQQLQVLQGIKASHREVALTEIEDGYINKDTAIKIAKETEPNANVKWEATFNKEWQIDAGVKLPGQPAWVVKGVFPLGNQILVMIDAVSGKQLAVTEIEVSPK
ncbi:hypothetical protein PAECIP111891_05211 [Paenibacillus allorhizoplanae]|uniref:PepSY domain-containing protein n=1 Tax=Paenibacillus allorhizoplanae TaxID=2905648 RepID=A0ABM9CRU5_9BACL|nr:PepSY domain-containing protein [Paenibacillus allorhizoplanae]CAH1221513.1 hypothetical protein PAECIP111891_05211 [Paenibacillus allorhizoplanae]